MCVCGKCTLLILLDLLITILMMMIMIIIMIMIFIYYVMLFYYCPCRYGPLSMVKCAIVNCRSGYPPNKAENELIAATGQAPCKCSVFAFPKSDRPEMRRRWISALKQSGTGWNPDHVGVCELHFLPEDFLYEIFEKTERQRKYLKHNAVPSVFNSNSELGRDENRDSLKLVCFVLFIVLLFFVQS